MLFDIEERCRLIQDRLAARVQDGEVTLGRIEIALVKDEEGQEEWRGPRSAESCLRGLAKTEMRAASRMFLMSGRPPYVTELYAETANDVSLRASLS